MRSFRFALVFGLLALAGCYYPTIGTWNRASIEQPQRVNFYYGYVIGRRDIPVEYVSNLPRPRWLPDAAGAGNIQQVFRSGIAEGIGLLPSLPAVEYTVMLDKGTTPPDWHLDRLPRAASLPAHPPFSADPIADRGQRASIIVVQNEQIRSEGLLPGQHALVRVVGSREVGYSGRVMPTDSLASADGLRVEDYVSARAMPVPLDYEPPPTTTATAATSRAVCAGRFSSVRRSIGGHLQCVLCPSQPRFWLSA